MQIALFLSFLLLASTTVMGQNKTITYKESFQSVVNPERGFYIATGTRSSKFEFLDSNQLRKYRTDLYQPNHATYKVRVSLLYRGYELDNFKDRPLSEDFLSNLQRDFDAIRAAGLKLILRFAYTNKATNGTCSDEYQICPPYGDAPRHVVMNHIRQLAPLFQKNADIIAVLQEGFIGIWGENYFTDYFGDASNSGTGKILDSSWRHRNELLKALLDAMPKSRMVQVRTPQIKQKFIYGPSAPVNSAPIDVKVAFTGSDASRIGFHNDCFLASPDDYGTYSDYGSSTQARKPAVDILRNYIKKDTRFTVVGGETCDDAFSPQNDCAPFGYAEEEMASMHYSYLNANYNNQVNNDWDSLGCMKNIEQNLGYHFILRQASLPVELTRGNKWSIELTLENKGYASLYNARPVNIVFRNTKTGEEFSSTLKTNAQLWFTGTVRVKNLLPLPANITAGDYQLYFSMPDANVLLSKRPEYSVQLYNEQLWEANTGYNSLQHTVRVK